MKLSDIVGIIGLTLILENRNFRGLAVILVIISASTFKTIVILFKSEKDL